MGMVQQVQCFEVSDGLVRLVLGLGGMGRGSTLPIVRSSRRFPPDPPSPESCYDDVIIIYFHFPFCPVLFFSFQTLLVMSPSMSCHLVLCCILLYYMMEVWHVMQFLSNGCSKA